MADLQVSVTMEVIMAKKLTEERLNRIKKEVLHGGGCLEKLAAEWNYTLEALREMLAAAYDGGVKNTQFKAIIRNSDRNASRLSKEELAKLQGMVTLKLVKQAKPLTVVLAPAIVPTTTEASPAPVVTPEDPMKELLRKKDDLQGELDLCKASLEQATDILGIRQKIYDKAKAVLEDAKKVAQNAEAEVTESQKLAQQAQEQYENVQDELRRVEAEIQELREKSIYLIDPWYNGELPEYGTFISSVEMEGVSVQEVPEEYLFKATVEEILLFDYVPDYKKARLFAGLVAKFELEGISYKLLVSDDRVKSLLEIYIGK